jgi:hypothetical protein
MASTQPDSLFSINQLHTDATATGPASTIVESQP